MPKSISRNFYFLGKKETIEALIEESKVAPHLRVLQKKLAEELTTLFIHCNT
jgi:tyrosyl-tRNA synthetase